MQVRFGDARDDDDACDAIDGSTTIDPLHPKMETCGDRLGDFILEGAAALGVARGASGKIVGVDAAKLREATRGTSRVRSDTRNWRGHGKLMTGRARVSRHAERSGTDD